MDPFPTIAAALVLAAACGEDPPPPDHALFEAALAAAPDDPAGAAAGCRRISEAGARAHCLVSVVELSETAVDAELCPTLDDPVWRDECWFLAAERHKRTAPVAEVLARCEQAGRYRNRCATHLWRVGAAPPLRPTSPEADARAIAAEEARLAGMLDPGVMARHTDPQAPTGPWRAVLMFYFRQAHPMDVRVCDALPGVQPGLTVDWCLAQASDAMGERLRRLREKNPHLVDTSVCRHPARTVPGTPWPWAGTKPDQWTDEPRMREILRGWAEERCEGEAAPQRQP